MTRSFLFAATAFALSGCVSASDPSLVATQGFAPGVSTVDLASIGPQPAQQPSSSDSDFPAQATVMTLAGDEASAAGLAAEPQAAGSIDALNRGITQTGDVRPIGNLYSSDTTAATPPPPAPGTLGVLPAPQVDASGTAAPTATGTGTLPVPTPSPLTTTAAQTAPQPALAVAATQPLVTQASQTPASAQTPAQTQASAQTYVTELPAEEPQAVELAVVAPPKKASIFSRLFASNPKPPKAVPAERARRVAQANPNVELASVDPSPRGASEEGGLPGVRMSALFEIQTGIEEDGEDASGVQMASAAGLARLSPNGLHQQTGKVEIACLKPGLVRVLKSVERHYGKPVIITSGYRSPKHNRRIGGASGSRHTSCEAADFQVVGVSKWELAKYLRTMPSRGGVGTYCHTESVHVDIGSPRDWNWRCRRRK